MPSSDPIQRFQDILDNIGRVEEYTMGMDLETFREGGIACDAAERCLERICEASKKLGSVAEELCPNIPWPKVRSLGNFLRHEYDAIERDLLWSMIERDLPALKLAAGIALVSLLKKEAEA